MLLAKTVHGQVRSLFGEVRLEPNTDSAESFACQSKTLDVFQKEILENTFPEL